ncbi:Beta-galactosidase [Zea mays]|uniref:Beta-galactosidase n=1 Tax=Zea mays TaxID=4577 RepID=A0A3L6D6B9_MAIZE|nr:Beta-galactosidase [Zea mays]
MGHLRDLDEAIKQAKLVLVSSDPTIHSSRNYEKVSQILSKMYRDQTSYSWNILSGLRNCTFTKDGFVEQLDMTWDKSNYLWYTAY